MSESELGKIEEGGVDILQPDKSWQDLSSVEKQKERMETKLYIPREVDGEPNRKELEIVREIEKKLSGHHAFIGVALFGSVIDGYGNESSDIDIRILYDNEKFVDLEDNINFLEIIKSIFPNGYKGPNVINGKGIHFFRQIINIESIDNEFKKYNEGNIDEDAEYDLVQKIAEMSRMVTGKNINEYRMLIASFLHLLSQKRKDNLIVEVVDFLSRFDENSLMKRQKRLPKLNEKQYQEILEKRKEMWRKRVEKIWGLKQFEQEYE